MLASYQLSERISVHSILFYGLALPIYRAATAIDKGLTAIHAALPHLLFWLAILAKSLGLAAIVAAVVVTVAMLPVQLWVGLGIVGAYAYVTFPRSKGQVR